MRKVNLEKRAQLTGEYVAESIYTSGLMRLVEYLLVDLSDLLETEGRRFGIVISYLTSIYNECQKMRLECDDETSGKIIYLFKPLVISEFKRLCRKHVSRADSVIVIIRELLMIITENGNFMYPKEAATLLKIINRLFDNIRNKAKNTNLEHLRKGISDFMDEGIVGKYELEKFSILEEEEKRIRKPLEGTGVRIHEEHSKVLEITWKEE